MNLRLRPSSLACRSPLFPWDGCGWLCALKVIKISHQFPAATGEDGDFRDRLARSLRRKRRSGPTGESKFEVYPTGSLVKTFSQSARCAKVRSTCRSCPLPTGAGIPECNLGLMPALVTGYDRACAGSPPIGKELARILDDKGMKFLTWVWQAGGIASRPIRLWSPDDAEGLEDAGGSKEMDLMIKAPAAR